MFGLMIDPDATTAMVLVALALSIVALTPREAVDRQLDALRRAWLA